MKNILIIFLFFGSVCKGQIINPYVFTSSPYGPELMSAGTWTFNDGASGSGQNIVANGTTTFVYFAWKNIAIVTGHTYKIEFDVSSYTSGNFRLGLGSQFLSAIDKNDIDYNANGHYSFNLAFTQSDLQIVFYNWTPAAVCHIDNISVKEVL